MNCRKYETAEHHLTPYNLSLVPNDMVLLWQCTIIYSVKIHNIIILWCTVYCNIFWVLVYWPVISSSFSAVVFFSSYISEASRLRSDDSPTGQWWSGGEPGMVGGLPLYYPPVTTPSPPQLSCPTMCCCLSLRKSGAVLPATGPSWLYTHTHTHTNLTETHT